MDLAQIPVKWILYIMLYGGAAFAALIASIYIYLRRGNAFAPDVTPPVRLRRWAAAFFAVVFMGHVLWCLFHIYCGDINSVYCWMVAVPDCIGLLTTVAGTLLAMLQDRKRPIWPFIMGMTPYAVLLGLNVVYPGGPFINTAIAYALLFYVLFSVYMVFAVRQYGRWLRDNYADLERKEVWECHVLVIVLLLLIISYGFDVGNLTIAYIVQFIQFPLFGFMLWRIETLPHLENSSMEQESSSPAPESSEESDLPTEEHQASTIPSNVIQQLLDERCVGKQLYLHHDLTLLQLATAVGINRFYLSQFFSKHGTTYNAYINDLRINHFVCLYREAVATRQSITAQQLAYDSGYRSYSTFSLAFKQRMGESVTVWIRDTNQA